MAAQVLVGRGVHGIPNVNAFTPQQALDAAAAGWLTDNQYYAIVANPHCYQILHAPHEDLDVDPHQRLAGNAQRIFLADFNANNNVAYTIIENPTEVVIRGTPYMTLRRSYTSSFERREYYPRKKLWVPTGNDQYRGVGYKHRGYIGLSHLPIRLISAAGQKIVHCGPNDHPYRKDMALAQEAGYLLADDIDGDSEAAANDRDQLAGDVWAYEPP